jgi:hypothetical protein
MIGCSELREPGFLVDDTLHINVEIEVKKYASSSGRDWVSWTRYSFPHPSTSSQLVTMTAMVEGARMGELFVRSPA